MQAESHSENQNQKDFIQDKLKLLLISDVSFTPPIPLSPMTAGLELAFEAKGACALQKGQCPFCKSCKDTRTAQHHISIRIHAVTIATHVKYTPFNHPLDTAKSYEVGYRKLL